MLHKPFYLNYISNESQIIQCIFVCIVLFPLKYSTETLNNAYLCLLFSEVGPPKNLVTSDVTDTSFAASWTAAPGNVKMYRVRWKSQFSEEHGEKTVPGDVTNTVLDGLSPETLYQVSVVAAYDRKESDPLTGQETTDGKTTDSSRL